MGEVVFWTIVRTVIVIPLIWLAKSYIGYDLWLTISILVIYGVVIHPAIIHFRLFGESNKELMEETLCSTCEHFNKSAVLCMKHDKHPAINYLPCDGIDWLPQNAVNEQKDIFL